VEVLELTLVEVLEQISREIKDVAVRNYPPEFAKGIHSYTLQRPSIYSIASGVMVDKMAQSGDGRVSDDVMAVLVFYKFLIAALLALPDSLRCWGVVCRGVKCVYPSPQHHSPEEHFPVGRTLMWFEPESTTTDGELLDKEIFCGHIGSRTAFKLKSNGSAWRIHHFSAFSKAEAEVLTLPLSILRADSATKWCIPDGKDTHQGRWSYSFPDMIELTMLDHPAYNLDFHKIVPTHDQPSLLPKMTFEFVSGLKEEKGKAVSSEDFGKAAALPEQLRYIESVSPQSQELELSAAIKGEDYPRAAEIKPEICKIHNAQEEAHAHSKTALSNLDVEDLRAAIEQAKQAKLEEAELGLAKDALAEAEAKCIEDSKAATKAPSVMVSALVL